MSVTSDQRVLKLPVTHLIVKVTGSLLKILMTRAARLVKLNYVFEALVDICLFCVQIDGIGFGAVIVLRTHAPVVAQRVGEDGAVGIEGGGADGLVHGVRGG